jgi:hypothetical protein
MTFTVPLFQPVHLISKHFSQQQSNQKKAKQVYLNTLAVFAVNFYLRCMGIKTDWNASDSWDPVMQAMMDVADLEIPNHGKLECRPVLPETQVVYIPPEVWSDRIGYVAVQLDQSLKEATLQGFVETVLIEELPLSQLRSLEDLLEHLSQIRQAKSVKMRVNLSQWFHNLFEAGWQSLETVLGTTDQDKFAFGLRSDSRLTEASVKRGKLIDVGLQLGSRAVALLVAITEDCEQKVEILVQVHPGRGETYLQPNLKLVLVSDAGVILQEVQSRNQDNYIQLKRFRGVREECFNIQVAFGDNVVTETFAI